MTKSAVIFSEENKDEKFSQGFRNKKSHTVTLSNDEYRQIIKEAYHEGQKDALKENGKANSSKKRMQQEGKEEAIRIHAKEKEANMQRFHTITARQDIELLRAHSVFPFTLFTDTLVIDTTKVTLAKKQLFATEYIATIPLKDLSDINVQTYLFLGTLMIRYMPQSNTPGMNEPVNIRIPNLKREDAIKAKNILKGALVAKAEEIDIAKLSPEEIKEVIHKFGESEGVI